jgi:4,5-DOPA dioxygenase extradiol
MGTTERMPALFLAHGNPMNAIADNDYTRAMSRLADDLPRPKAVLVVSAHWGTQGTLVLASEHPRTVHDFGGFPRELYEVEYAAPGASEYARIVRDLLPGVSADTSWGLDHAAWTPLRHMWPDADVPVFELSVDMRIRPEAHWELGERLAPLREAGVLVVGGGNIVHSFVGIDWSDDATPRPWAEEFDAWVADALVRGDRESLVHYESAGEIARRSFATNEHYLPLLYPAAIAESDEPVTFPHTGIEMATMSMRCVRWG